MNKVFLILSFVLFSFMANAKTKIEITIDNRTMIAILEDNDATKSLVEKLSTAPITITMNNYGGFEKVGALPWTLPSSDTRITTKPGDIMLYTSDNIVIFYGQNTWSYTPLGVLETTDAAEISDFVDAGTKQVTISLYNPAALETIKIDEASYANVYSIDGKLMTQRPLKAGIYIIDSKKVLVN